jgi:hypothetical protein
MNGSAGANPVVYGPRLVNINDLRRRTVAAACLSVTLLFGTACGSSEDTGAAAPPATPTAAASTPAADNTAETCKAVEKAKADFGKTIAGSLIPGADRVAAGKKAFTDMSSQLKAAAASATDAGLASTLQEVATAAGGIAATADVFEADSAAYDQAGAKLEELCRAAEPPSADASSGGLGSGKMVGAKGSACELPVTFELAASWKPKAVKMDPDSPLAELARKGPLTMVCEVDGKDTGDIGFIRVWSDAKAKGSPRESLLTMMSGEKVKKSVLKDLTLGGAQAAEVTYDKYSEATEEFRTERAFAVRTPRGAVVVTLGGFDAQEQGMVSAYELAKRTLAVNS